MNPINAFQTLATMALRQPQSPERLIMIDCLASLGEAAGLSSLSRELQNVADSSRIAERLQLTFIERLSGTSLGDAPKP